MYKVNTPPEFHASKIYTRAMFENFGEMLYEVGSYVLSEVVPRHEYIARHVKKDSKEKWCKNEFLIQVKDLADEFKCECGMFDHFGVMCSHVLKVSSFSACFVILPPSRTEVIIDIYLKQDSTHHK